MGEWDFLGLSLSDPFRDSIITLVNLQKEMDMLHVVHIQSDEQYAAATEILDFIKGTWHARGSADAPVLFLPDEHYNALIKAGIIPSNGNEVKANGKKVRTTKARF
jgi:hypothetical protein